MKMLVFGILLFIATAKACPIEYDIEFKSIARAVVPLPTGAVPIRYNITLEPHFDTKTFTGSVQIELTLKTSSKTITLHKNLLNISADDVDITLINGTNLPPMKTKVFWNESTHFLTIDFDSSLEPNDYILNFKKYSGILSDTDFAGFYIARYSDSDNKTKEFATTQFQSIGARRAFPCFDEPQIKANFTVHLIRDKNHISITNEELMSSLEIEPGKFIDSYRETRIMSTYLVAFVVTDYLSTETRQGQRVFADKDSVTNGDADYALQTGIDVLSAFEKFTGIRYTFSKIDQIAIPDDYFSPGAMENWGLVTYRKSRLVAPYNEQTTSGFQRTVAIIAHEYTHQWFGNLVTCSSWMYVWLNEGFANYFEYFIPSTLNWDLNGLFLLDSVHGALKSDISKDITAMNNESSQTIVRYQKAGSVIRMLKHIVTEDVFEKSLKHYLERHAYKPVSPIDLYTAFQDVIEKEGKMALLGDRKVSEIMGTWDSQPGYPILNVTRDYETGKIQLRQERYFGRDPIPDDKSNWYIPLSYVLSGNDSTNFTVTTADSWMFEKTMTLEKFPTDGWIIFNKQQSGYYRVDYDRDNWNRIIDQLNNINHSIIHTFNKAQLLDDAFTFAETETLNYSLVFDLTKFLKKEKEYVPIAIFLKHIGLVDTKLSNESGRENYKSYLTDILIGDALQRVGMSELESDTNTDEYLRIDIMNWLSKMGHSEFIDYALNTFRNENISISPNLQVPIYCGAMRTGTKEDWDKLHKLYNSTKNTLHRSRILNGLGCSESHETVLGFLDLLLNVANIATNENYIDPLTGFRSVLNAGDYGVNYVYQYVTAKFSEVKNLKGLKELLKDLGAKLNTIEQQTKLEALAAATENAAEAESIKAAVELVKSNINWNKQYGPIFNSWFSTYVEQIGNGGDGGGDGATNLRFDVSIKILLGTLLISVIMNILK